MRTFVSIVIMLSLVYQCTVQLGVMAWYNLNKDYIANTLCVNRSKPESKCNGRCQLNKQLSKTSENQDHSGQQIPSKSQKIEVTDLLLFEGINLVLHFNEDLHNQPTPTVPHLVDYTPISSVFHPPAIT